MIRPQFFIETLKRRQIDFYAGVPDSLLKNICAYMADHLDGRHHIITANEGGAIGIAAGYHLATGKIPVVYMQNSGEGNIINPLASLIDKEVYRIPVLLIIGWRGKPGVHDEPQHVKQGKITLSLLETMGIKFEILDQDEQTAYSQIEKAVDYMQTTHESFAMVIEKGTFEPYLLQNAVKNGLTLSREEAIQTVAATLDEKDVIVSTTGMISRELFEYRTAKKQDHRHDFLTVGAMGHANQIALGIALKRPERRIWCFDGDGASIMHMGGMAIIASKKPKNYTHIIFNNGAHDSVGGQPTVGLDINLPKVAEALGYHQAYSVDKKEELISLLKEIKHQDGPLLLQICVKKGNRKDLGRPTTSPIDNKEAFMAFLSE